MLLPLSRFFRPSAPILGDKTKQEKQLLYVLGQQGESHYSPGICSQDSQASFSRVTTTLVAPILHQGLFLEREAPFQHILSQTIFPSHHSSHDFSCCQKAASSQLPVVLMVLPARSKAGCSPYGQTLGRCRGPGVLWQGWHSFYTQR